MPSPSRSFQICALALAAIAQGACGDDAEPGPYSIVLDPGGLTMPSTWVAVYAPPGSTPTIATCGTPPTVVGPLTCGGDRLTLERAAGTLTLKIEGFEHTRHDVPLAAAGPHRLVLTAIETRTTPDYTTGFVGGDDGRAAFEALALQFDTELGRALVVKFYLEGLTATDSPPTVYFQDTRRHLLHYDFYRNVLGRTGSRADFEVATYLGEDRSQAAGTLVAYTQLTSPLARPVSLTFFPSDDLSPDLARRLHALVEARMPFLANTGLTDRLVYLPAGAVQEEAMAGAAAAFESVDAPWVSHDALYGGLTEQRLNIGVAYGTLRRMTPEELASTVVSFHDILLLTRLPNDLPLVGGTLTEELQTPLAHVNVAARARGTPNLALLSASTHPTIAPLMDTLVRFEVTRDAWTLAPTTLAEAQAFWEHRTHPPFSPPFSLAMTGLPGFAELGFADADSIGVKAANIAELHALLGELAPDGFVIPFSAYDDFMQSSSFGIAHCLGARNDCLEEDRAEALCEAAYALCAPPGENETLAAHVQRLLADPGFQSDSPLREASLDSLRWLIRHLPVDPDFGRALDASVLALVGSGRVRLRSSTNAEDLPDFSGAGLYDSYGAAASGKDRASEEVRKTWASTWNWRAFEERAFWSIDHLAVRMGVAVHPSYPDERVNGVLITRNLADPTIAGFYVNAQLGEVSVTNPADGAIPEVFTIVEAPGGGVQVIRQRFSSLSAGQPLLTEAELGALYQAAGRIQAHFAPLYGESPYDFALDLEFKFYGPERNLIVKQVRPYAAASGVSR